MKKSALSKMLKVGVSAALIILLLNFIDWEEFRSTVQSANLFYILIAGSLVFTGIWISVLRWDLVLQQLNIVIPRRKLARLYLEGTFLGNFLPTSVGGDLYKYAVLAKQFQNQKKDIAISMLLERGSGFLTLFGINIVLLPFFYGLVLSDKSFAGIEIVTLSALFAIVMTFFFLNKVDILIQKLPFSIVLYDKLRNFFLSGASVFDRKLVMSTSTYSFLFVCNILIGQLLYLKAFGAHIDPLYVLFAISLIYIVGVLPISLNSIGVAEGLTVFFYGFVGVSPEVSLAVALTGRVCAILMSVLGGILLLGSPLRVARPERSHFL